VKKIKELQKKLEKDGRSYGWFINEYLSDRKYHSIMNQINGYSTVQSYLITAIEKYLTEG